MELEQQLAEIINDAPEYGVPSVVVEKAIAPVLKAFASKLKCLEYYVLQNLQEDWVLTTLANPSLSEEKRVIYAFVSVQDAATFQGKSNPDLMAMPISVAQLLFRLSSLQQVDSIIFLENSANLNHGIEIKRELLANSIMLQIRQMQNIPPDLA